MGNFKVNSRFSRFMNGKGFYIALAVCLVAVGSAAYVAANSSIGLLNNKKNVSSSAAKASSTVSSVWGSDSAQPTGNTVSGVPRTSSAAIPSSSAVASSSKSSSTSHANAAKLIFMMPVSGDIITPFSNNALVYDQTMDDWRVHNGIDIAAKVGTAVVADADGTVTDVRDDLLLGKTVVIDHGQGLVSTLANLTKDVTVKKGQKVNVGDVIGCVGQTAQGEILLKSHLHFELSKNGVCINPQTYIKNS